MVIVSKFLPFVGFSDLGAVELSGLLHGVFLLNGWILREN